jgi:polyhydroxyalkanoate synthesis regulator phasin
MRLFEFASPNFDELPENFLMEAAKNTHLEHLEDEILNGGEEGAQEAINVLYSLEKMLQGNSEAGIDVTVKWDGAPALFCGINPENGEFFVGTKGVWSKKNPKILYTPNDVDEHYEGDLANKLKTALEYLPQLGIDGVLQGDMMFTNDSLEIRKVDGEPSVVMQPNTIAYVVPLSDPLAREIRRAQLGIVFHTTYTGGPTLHDMSASFGADVSSLNNTPDVWFRDASYEDVSGEATLTHTETDWVKGEIQSAERTLEDIDREAWQRINTQSPFTSLFKTFVNQNIRQGKTIPERAQDVVDDFMTFFQSKKSEEMEKLKTERGRQKKQESIDQGLQFFNDHMDQLVNIVDLYKRLVKLKTFFVQKLEQLDKIGTFVRNGDDFEAATPEGFVAIDHLSGNAVKLVNRMEFSMRNFQGWG